MRVGDHLARVAPGGQRLAEELVQAGRGYTATQAGLLTSLVFMGAAMLCVGLGVGMTMQNFVLVVQNAVPLKDIGAASSTVSFFRSLGGTIGVSALGILAAVLLKPVTLRTSLDQPDVTRSA